MRLAACEGRAMLVVSVRSDHVVGIDVERGSDGDLPSDPHQLLGRWQEFVRWASAAPSGDTVTVPLSGLTCPVGVPGQVFAIGLNYGAHAAETGHPTVRAAVPPVFTKFPTSLTGPYGELVLSGDTVDWEAELVVVVGTKARNVRVEDALGHVAGYSVGQDFSDRQVQKLGSAPQYSLAKSYSGYGPIGPWIATGDEVDDARDLRVECEVNGQNVQLGRSSDLIWSVPRLIESLSSVCTLMPGDVIFTGTPSGVGVARKPPVFLAPGDVVVTRIEGIGELRQTCRRP